MNLLLFEDGRVDQLYPITTGRAAYAVSCGGYRLADLLADSQANVRAVVRGHLQHLQREDFPQLDGAFAKDQPLLLLNARVAPAAASIRRVFDWAAKCKPGVAMHEGDVIAALLPPDAPPPSADLRYNQLDDYFRFAGVSALPVVELPLPVFNWPHDVIRHHMAIFGENLKHRLAGGEYREIADGVFAASGVRAAGEAKLGQYVVTDTASGPILLEAGASIGPYVYLSGPAYFGAGARVLEHAAIKDAVSHRAHDEDRRRGGGLDHRAVHQQAASRLPRPQLPGQLDQPRRRHLQQRPEKHLRSK